jgi:protein involved in polysaccharide export with SLBB domain
VGTLRAVIGNLTYMKAAVGTGLLALALAFSAPLGPSVLRAQQGGTAVPVERGASAIRPGDVVKLTVARHEDLTGDFTVTEDLTVTIPKLGEIDVSADTHRTLKERVIRALQETVVSPAIELVVMKRVRVLGEVNEPGLYYVDPTMTVADAMALAGGPTSNARRGTTILRRNGQTVITDLRTETLISDSPIQTGDELEVPQLSWISRNGLTLLTSAVGFVSVFVALAWR